MGPDDKKTWKNHGNLLSSCGKVGAGDEDDGKNMQFIAIAKKYVNTMYI